jgi:hypothetical protein
MVVLLPHLRAHFDPLQDRFACFHANAVQVEGWFKGELLSFLAGATARGAVRSFGREVRTGSNRIDLRIEPVAGPDWLIELKHWHIGQQGTSKYSPAFYFGDATSVGITADVRKLRDQGGASQKFVLALVTSNPGPRDWASGIARFNEKFAPLRLSSLVDPAAFPEGYLLGLLQVM